MTPLQLPGHNCTMDEFNAQNKQVQSSTIEALDLMLDSTRRRFFAKTLKKFPDDVIKAEYRRRGLAEDGYKE
jgi:uncharacterized protein with FMN-binding domain